MESNLFAQNAALHDRMAEHYDEQLGGDSRAVLARQAFGDLVGRCVAPGSTLLDFGCGTGLDAHRYARQGYRVLAYDHSPGMMEQLKRGSAAEIASGQIIPYSVSYLSFLEDFPNWPAPRAVVANFAVLNSIRDLEPLFDVLARHLASPGWIFLSVLNPIHWARLIGPRPREAAFYVAEHLHTVPGLLQAAPQFHLMGRANAGTFVRYDALQSKHAPPLWWGPANSNRRGVYAYCGELVRASFLDTSCSWSFGEM